MIGAQLVDLILGVVVVALLAFRQLKTRPVGGIFGKLTLILAVAGVAQVASVLDKAHSSPLILASLAGSLLLAAVFAVIRARTVRVWLSDGQPWSQGSGLTVALWAAAFAVHLGYDVVLDASKAEHGIGGVSTLLYLALSLAVQRAVVQARARRLPCGSGGGGR